MPGSERDPSEADERFAALVELLAADGASLGAGRAGFGSGTLQVNGRIFAMVSHGQLVLKLPAGRVRDLIERGDGSPFDAGKGRPMREWVALRAGSGGPWRDLAREALAYVRGQTGRTG